VQFSSQNATIEQLKGSGNIRLLDTESAHMISEYDKMTKELDRDYSMSITESQKMEELHFKLFDVYAMQTLLTFPERKERNAVFLLTSLPMRNDKEMMKEYTGWLKHAAGIYNYQVKVFLEPIKKKAEELLNLLKKEYHLK
jgi:hypothetical protein